VALQAEGAQIGEVALAAAFNYGHNMIRIPEALARLGLHSPCREQPGAGRASLALNVMPGLNTIGGADCADAAVSLEYFVAEVAGVGAEFPFLHAEAGAEGEAAFGYFETAPAA
jgi:hypothetical protein